MLYWFYTMAALTKKILKDAVKEGLVDKYEKVPYDEAFCQYWDPRVIVIGGDLYRPNVAAHEVGHAIDTKDIEKEPIRKHWIQATGAGYHWGSKAALLAGTIAALSGANAKALGAIGAAGFLSSTPYLMRELAAGKNGYNVMRQYGQDRLTSLQTLGGLTSNLKRSLLGFIPLGGRLLYEPARTRKNNRQM